MVRVHKTVTIITVNPREIAGLNNQSTVKTAGENKAWDYYAITLTHYRAQYAEQITIMVKYISFWVLNNNQQVFLVNIPEVHMKS